MQSLVVPRHRCHAALAATLHAAEDDYPARPVKIVVPFAAGGSTDVVARILADKLGAELKQTFIVDNRPGASGNIGADLVAKSNADGYTLLMGTTGVLAINAHLYKDMPFDPEGGPGFIRDTIIAVERMRASDAEKAAIYEGNARRLLRLR